MGFDGTRKRKNEEKKNKKKKRKKTEAMQFALSDSCVTMRPHRLFKITNTIDSCYDKAKR